MTYIEHYFENLLYHDCDIANNANKDALSKDVQEAVELCAQYVKFTLFDTYDDFKGYIEGNLQLTEIESRTICGETNCEGCLNQHTGNLELCHQVACMKGLEIANE